MSHFPIFIAKKSWESIKINLNPVAVHCIVFMKHLFLYFAGIICWKTGPEIFMQWFATPARMRHLIPKSVRLFFYFTHLLPFIFFLSLQCLRVWKQGISYANAQKQGVCIVVSNLLTLKKQNLNVFMPS